MTEKTKAVPGSARNVVKHGRAKPVVKESTYLVEFAGTMGRELDQAEVVLAAKGIAGKVQDMAENLSKLEANDIMPMLDGFRDAFGPQAADQFSQVSTAKIRELISAVQTTKSALDNEISRLEQTIGGAGGSDAALDADIPPPPAPGPEAGAEGEMPPAEAGEGAEGVPELPPAEGADQPLGATGFAGRPRKEGAKIKGRRLTEDNAAESPDFKRGMDALAAMSPACFKDAQEIIEMIHDLAIHGGFRNKLLCALGHIVAMAAEKTMWDDPEEVSDLGLSIHFADLPLAELEKAPDVKKIIKRLRGLAHKIALKHNGHLQEEGMSAPLRASPSPLAAGTVMVEGRRRARNIRRLRESRNPDKMILSVFRNVFRECRNVTAAVTGTARAFGIDTHDVITIIREAKSLADKLKEDAVPALMGVEMGEPDGNNNPALMSQVPKATAATPQAGQPNKPMTPTDMRQASLARKTQDQAAGIQPKQPITATPQMAPVQQVSPNQKVQPVMTPQMQQQQNANKKKPLPNMPGKIATNSNIRM